MKLSIKARIIIAFVVLITLSGVIYFIGASSAGRLNDSISEIINVNVARMSYASKLAEDIQFITKREKDIVITTDREQLDDLEKEVDTRVAEVTDKLEKLRNVSDDKGLELIASFDLKWQAYLKCLSRIKKAAIVINTDSSKRVAYDISRTEARSTALEAVSWMGQIVKKNEKQLEQANQDTTAVYESGRTTMLITLVVSIVIALFITFWILTTISKVVNYITSASESIASASRQMAASSQQTAQGASEQASSTEEISSSMEEMASSIQQNMDNAQQTEKLGTRAAQDIIEGSETVNKTTEAMKSIADKISVIGEIARQTNLLALNAAVEAARAGDHGRGFAVVAAEVRKLAERTQVAAAEINRVSGSSVAIAERSGKLLGEIVPVIQKSSQLIQEISASSIEQNTGASQINTALQQLNQVVQSNASSSEEMAAAAEELLMHSNQLNEAVSILTAKEMKAVVPARTKANLASYAADTHSSNGHGKMMPAKVASHKNGVSLNMNHDTSSDVDFEPYR
jgi:methyl-accepting chemotaxis protein